MAHVDTFELKEFVDGVEGQVNRRLGVLSLLYNKRLTDLDQPSVSLLELECRMSFPAGIPKLHDMVSVEWTPFLRQPVNL